ncbi:MAG: lectin, partial [Rhodospirillaceae bacterium]|nr:lectin [Rhodospirillaceae bacterium]
MKTIALTAALLLATIAPTFAQDAPMVPQIPPRPAAGPLSFFVTSVGIGDGADLGGLAGADAHCQNLAAAVDAGEGTWRAYLSTQATTDSPAINARDRIGQGPWYNANGVRIAANLGQLHGDTLALARKGNFINIRTAVTETGEMVPGEIKVV